MSFSVSPPISSFILSREDAAASFRDPAKSSPAKSVEENRFFWNQAQYFQDSVPFTLDRNRVYAKSMDQQWKKTTTYVVREPFPCVFMRQPVVRKLELILSPTEVAIDDIQDRIHTMKEGKSELMRTFM